MECQPSGGKRERTRLSNLRLQRRLAENAASKVRDFRPRYRPEEVLDEFHLENELIFGANLDDGWLRLCAKHTFEKLIFYKPERYGAEWTKAFSKNFKATNAMRKWPDGIAGLSRFWKQPCVDDVRLLPIKWVPEVKQYRVEFLYDRGVTVTFWFTRKFKPSTMGDGWVTPREISRTVPFKK